MEGDFITIRKSLRPLSWIYGFVVGFRNTLFEMGVLKSRAFDIPVISVGNITVGGTGKTPHVEYLARLLKDLAHTAILSRGYKRKSHGFILATSETPMKDIGDEPYQMKQKFPEVEVAVDKKRTRGIRKLTEDNLTTEKIDVILLDDAFQHRYVKPGISILLVDYHRQIIYDELLPAGRMREPLKAKDRADIVIITKCPKDLKPMEFRVLTKQMKLYPYQQLYFTTLDYDTLQPIFKEANTASSGTIETLGDQNILLLTGIASPEQLIHDLETHTSKITPLTFADHHSFKPKDILRINEAFAALPSPKLIITTEKDSVRLKGVEGLSDEVKAALYVLPLKIKFIFDEEKEKFNNRIIGYVRKNSRNCILAKGKDDNNPKDSDRAGDRPRTISFRNI